MRIENTHGAVRDFLDSSSSRYKCQKETSVIKISIKMVPNTQTLLLLLS